jgi:hypothetical protein
MSCSGVIESGLMIGFARCTTRRQSFLLTGVFSECTDTSRMSREAPVRICEKLRVKFPWLTRPTNCDQASGATAVMISTHEKRNVVGPTG